MIAESGEEVKRRESGERERVGRVGEKKRKEQKK